jgi:hypothetical protein
MLAATFCQHTQTLLLGQELQLSVVDDPELAAAVTAYWQYASNHHGSCQLLAEVGLKKGCSPVLLGQGTIVIITLNVSISVQLSCWLQRPCCLTSACQGCQHGHDAASCRMAVAQPPWLQWI